MQQCATPLVRLAHRIDPVGVTREALARVEYALEIDIDLLGRNAHQLGRATIILLRDPDDKMGAAQQGLNACG